MWKQWSLLLLGVGTLLLVGCCPPHPPAPAAPDAGWRPLKTNPSIAPLQSGVDVMIAYGQSGCLHTALWVATADKPLLFWDPAGGYGIEHSPEVSRRRDVLSVAPTLEEYLAFRWLLNTEVVEIFRFQLSPTEAERLYGLLEKGGSSAVKEPEYNPATPGTFCSHAVSGFLKQYAPRRFPLEEAYLYPHIFARHLYALKPDQAILIRRGRTALVLP